MTRASEAFRLLNLALIDTDPACQNDDRFILDDQPADTLAYICHACPLLTLCRTYAVTAKPPAGVWAGQRWSGPRRPGRPRKEPANA
jgi:hypothetical protein